MRIRGVVGPEVLTQSSPRKVRHFSERLCQVIIRADEARFVYYFIDVDDSPSVIRAIAVGIPMEYKARPFERAIEMDTGTCPYDAGIKRAIASRFCRRQSSRSWSLGR